MTLRRGPLRRGHDLRRVQLRLRALLDVGRRRHVADLRFYQLLSDADQLPAFAKSSRGPAVALRAQADRPDPSVLSRGDE